MAKRCNGIDSLIGPQLAKLIASNIVKYDIDKRLITAIASDGIEVELGYLIDKQSTKAIEAYLTAHPTPDTW